MQLLLCLPRESEMVRSKSFILLFLVSFIVFVKAPGFRRLALRTGLEERSLGSCGLFWLNGRSVALEHFTIWNRSWLAL